jgi:hypothetical protein
MAYQHSRPVVALGASLGAFDQAREVLVPIDGEDRIEDAGSTIDRAPIALPSRASGRSRSAMAFRMARGSR